MPWGTWLHLYQKCLRFRELEARFDFIFQCQCLGKLSFGFASDANTEITYRSESQAVCVFEFIEQLLVSIEIGFTFSPQLIRARFRANEKSRTWSCYFRELVKEFVGGKPPT